MGYKIIAARRGTCTKKVRRLREPHRPHKVRNKASKRLRDYCLWPKASASNVHAGMPGQTACRILLQRRRNDYRIASGRNILRNFTSAKLLNYGLALYLHRGTLKEAAREITVSGIFPAGPYLAQRKRHDAFFSGARPCPGNTDDNIQETVKSYHFPFTFKHCLTYLLILYVHKIEEMSRIHSKWVLF